MRHIKAILNHQGEHWVGDGFPVRSIFSYREQALMPDLSPFLLLDHAGPASFTPTEQRRGVGEHPHRGFETVTIVYDGEVEHQDSTGSGGTIGPGDVQWMTAASGILHEEFHSQAFARQGGQLHMAQLWVNLPARDKLASPGYQTLLNETIPQQQLPDDAGSVRIIAGEWQGLHGPARTFTPINVWDITLNAGGELELTLAAQHNLALVVISGSVNINDSAMAVEDQLVTFRREAGTIRLSADHGAVVLLLSGEPIDEPIAAYGPFVMNTDQEIRQALDDYRHGVLGQH